MSRVTVAAGAAAIGAGGYAIACWLAKMTEYAERVDRERDSRPPVAQAVKVHAQQQAA